MKTVLLTLGRLPKALDVARSFAALGWRVIVADPFSNHLLRVSRSVAKSIQVPAPADDGAAYVAALADIVRREGVDLVAPVSEEIMYVALLRDRLPARTQVLAMPAEALHDAHDKFTFARQAARMGLGVPRTALASEAAALDIAGESDFVLKERHSCGGGGVTFWKRGASFPRSDSALVQTRIRGAEFSSCTLAHEGRVRATAVYRATIMSGTVAVGFERVDHAEIESWISRYVARSDWTGFISFDFMVGEGLPPCAIECNPRLTSGVHFFETQDIAPAILDSSAPLRLRPERLLQQFWSCLQETQRALPDLALARRRLSHLRAARDVTWSRADPWPLLAMPWTAREILRHAARDHVSLAVAATRDLRWSPMP